MANGMKPKGQRVKYHAPLTEKLRAAYQQLNKKEKREARTLFATVFKIQPATVRHKISGVHNCYQTEVTWMETHVQNIKDSFSTHSQPVTA